MTDAELIPITAAADRLGIPRSTAYRLAKNGQPLVAGVEAVLVGQRRWKVRTADLDRFLRADFAGFAHAPNSER